MDVIQICYNILKLSTFLTIFLNILLNGIIVYQIIEHFLDNIKKRK